MKQKRIFDIISEIAKNNKGKIALVGDNTSITYDELIDDINLVSQALLCKGVTKVSTIALCGFVSIRYIIVYLSVLSIGAKITVLNSYVGLDILSELIDFADADFIIFENSLKYKCDEASRITFSESTKINIDHIYFVNELFDDSIKVDIDKLDKIRNDDNIFAKCMIYSSGTDSFPKLSVLSEKSLTLSILKLYERIEITYKKCGEIILLAIPFNHLFATIVLLCALLYMKVPVCITNDFTAKNILHIIKKNDISILATVPTIFNNIAKEKGFFDEKNKIKLGFSSGSNISDEQYKLFKKELTNAVILNAYAMTETSGVVAISSENDYQNDFFGHSGKVLEEISVKIANNNEILIKCDFLKDKYYKLPDEKQGIDRDGYFHTGDIGEFDSDGNLYVKGRLKDIIIKGGENISSKEIEEVLLSDRNITKAAVIGKKSEKYGEDIYAYVVIKENYIFDEIKTKKIIADALGNFKVPAKITVIDKMPMNGLGKIEKKKLEVL